MKIKEVIAYLEEFAPIQSQESYDNCGLQLGDHSQEITAVLVCLDCTEDVVQEAIDKGCNLIISHHPVIFSGLKSLTGKNYVERTLLRCMQHSIALYAMHTNLDNHIHGVNFQIAKQLGLNNVEILRPKSGVLYKLIVYSPLGAIADVNAAAFSAGAGNIGNYEECAFETKGVGSFKAKLGANPAIGKIGELEKHEEIKVEYLVSSHTLSTVLSAIKKVHPYEEVAHEIVALKNKNQTEGSGMVGELENEMDEVDFLHHLKRTFLCGTIRHTALLNKKVKRIAFCGGSGSFLLPDAKATGATVFITGDFKYHEFFDAEKQIMIADIGHYESEQFTTNLIADILKKKFTTFAIQITGINTNPINYF